MSDATAPHQKKKTAGFPRMVIGFVAICLGLALLSIVLGVRIHRLKTQAADTQKQLTQAKGDAAKAQAGLDKVKSASADLQSQLDKAKSQQAHLQAQLDLSKDASKDLQAQLDREKTQSTDLQAQLDKSKAQSADLQAQVTQGAAGSAQLLTQLDQEKIQSMDLQTRLQTAERDITQLQPLLLKARHMPVTTTFEKDRGGQNFTLHISNLYLQPLTVNTAITGSARPRSQSNVIGGGATLNVERLTAGEQVAITSEGDDPVNLTVR